MAGLLQVRLAHLESVWCAISHPKAWENMAQDHFYPFQAHIQGSRGPKMFCFMAGLLQVRPAHIRKCSRLYCPITYFPEDPFNPTSQIYSKL